MQFNISILYLRLPLNRGSYENRISDAETEVNLRAELFKWIFIKQEKEGIR